METTATSTKPRQAELRYPRLHAGQRAVLSQARRINWLSAGRRWRKTTQVMRVAVHAASHGQEILWGAPTVDQVRIGWAETYRSASDVATFHESTREVRFPGGGMIRFRSLDDPDNARGHTAHGVVVDEAADVSPAAWHEVLRPMLMTTEGWAWLLGTPKGRNWFYREWHSACDDEHSIAWQAPTLGAVIEDGRLIRKPHPLENPDVSFSELEAMFRSMPERAFRQEILAEFLEDGGGVFRGVRALSTLSPGVYNPRHEYVIGVDWGRQDDFCVFSVLDATTHQQVYLDRFNGVDYVTAANRLLALNTTWHPSVIVPESNSIGQPIIDALWTRNVPLQPFTTTNASKKIAIDALALAFERGDVHLLADETQTGELEAFQCTTLPGGGLRYSAPEGLHDDTVMALALAWTQAKSDRSERAPEDMPVDNRTIDDMPGMRERAKSAGTAPKREGGKWWQ